MDTWLTRHPYVGSVTETTLHHVFFDPKKFFVNYFRISEPGNRGQGESDAVMLQATQIGAAVFSTDAD
jgi:hypothetical protein